jgi:hypothetical protein
MSDSPNTLNEDATLAGPGAGRRAELAPGARLGRYGIVRLLGRGGMRGAVCSDVCLLTSVF